MKNYIECFECDGVGMIDGTLPECFKPASECCGGCYTTYTCKYCSGSGVILALDDDMSIDIVMLNAYNDIIDNYNQTKKTLKSYKTEISEDALATYNTMIHEKDLVNLEGEIKNIHLQVSHLKKQILHNIEFNINNK